MKPIITLAATLGFACVSSAWAQAPAQLSEGQARATLASYGCNNISTLSFSPKGWYGQCAKGGATRAVMVTHDGQASMAQPDHITEANARAAMMQYGCTNVSVLSRGPTGTWHGQCSKSGATRTIMVGTDGTVSQAPATHITEAHARSALMQFGCANVSALNTGPDGSWLGQCSKGGKTSNVSVDVNGVASMSKG